MAQTVKQEPFDIRKLVRAVYPFIPSPEAYIGTFTNVHTNTGTERNFIRNALKEFGILIVENSVIIEDINATFHSDCKDIEEAKELLNNEKLTRFNELIDKRFDDNTLTELLNCFETRDDDRIKEVVSDNADVPTIFEYITGIIWYKISGRKGNILK